MDGTTAPAVVTAVHRHTPICCVAPDAEFVSERNCTCCHRQLRAVGIIPARSRSSCRASGVRVETRERRPSENCSLRSLIESVFPGVKHKLSGRAPGRTFHPESLQTLLLSLAVNPDRLRLLACRK